MRAGFIGLEPPLGVRGYARRLNSLFLQKEKTGIFTGRIDGYDPVDYFLAPLTAVFSAVPALNAGALDALILIGAPVAGLRPLRAARLRTSNVPNPTSATLSPFLSVAVMTSISAAILRSASALLLPVLVASACRVAETHLCASAP